MSNDRDKRTLEFDYRSDSIRNMLIELRRDYENFSKGSVKKIDKEYDSIALKSLDIAIDSMSRFSGSL